jgi:hypothetical protein
MGAEATVIACSDGVDNDGDGFIDCADTDCQEPGTDEAPGPGRIVCSTTEDTDYLCSDGVDNDGNGFVDCGDFGCSRNLKVTVCGTKCVVTAELENTAEMCADGIDNDCNGFTDCSDFGCSRGVDFTVCCTPDESTKVCVGNLCKYSEASDDACSDGIDNDCNGYVDCKDFGCSQGAAVSVCADKPENTSAACSDGIDNDHDGYIDCADWDCNPIRQPPTRRSPRPVDEPEEDPQPTEVPPFSYCLQAVPEPGTELSRCSDGIDNDRDGVMDCDDWECWELSLNADSGVVCQ